MRISDQEKGLDEDIQEKLDLVACIVEFSWRDLYN